ncbi:hypothetical protein ACIP98_39680 [Streptomyces sp. NPDC088354]|uniref:hypothetical protein n=1 Tax=Streptomyces sp. NPDC088354 TaxID=3365856 RepID=UPI003812D9D3
MDGYTRLVQEVELRDGSPVTDSSAGKGIYQLVKGLAAGGGARGGDVPGPEARQTAILLLADRPAADAEFEGAVRANALFDAHREDPEFGYRFLADEARGTGVEMADRTAWRICRDIAVLLPHASLGLNPSSFGPHQYEHAPRDSGDAP